MPASSVPLNSGQKIVLQIMRALIISPYFSIQIHTYIHSIIIDRMLAQARKYIFRKFHLNGFGQRIDRFYSCQQPCQAWQIPRVSTCLSPFTLPPCSPCAPPPPSLSLSLSLSLSPSLPLSLSPSLPLSLSLSPSLSLSLPPHIQYAIYVRVIYRVDHAYINCILCMRRQYAITYVIIVCGREVVVPPLSRLAWTSGGLLFPLLRSLTSCLHHSTQIDPIPTTTFFSFLCPKAGSSRQLYSMMYT